MGDVATNQPLDVQVFGAAPVSPSSAPRVKLRAVPLVSEHTVCCWPSDQLSMAETPSGGLSNFLVETDRVEATVTVWRRGPGELALCSGSETGKR